MLEGEDGCQNLRESQTRWDDLGAHTTIQDGSQRPSKSMEPFQSHMNAAARSGPTPSLPYPLPDSLGNTGL